MAEPTEGEATAIEDTSVSEVVEASTKDDSDVELEDIEVDFDDDDEEADEEPAKTTKDESTDDSKEFEQSKEDDEQEEADSKVEKADTETVEEDTTKTEESQKTAQHEAFKRREAERKLREERQAREKENLDRYLEEAGDDEDELAKRQIEVERHYLSREKATVLQDKVNIGIEKAVANIDLFRNSSPEVKEELAKSLDDFEKMYVKKDKTGNFLEVEADVYQYLQDKADSIRRLTGIGAREQTKQKANEKMRTVPRPTRTPKEPVQDSDLIDFDKGWN